MHINLKCKVNPQGKAEGDLELNGTTEDIASLVVAIMIDEPKLFECLNLAVQTLKTIGRIPKLNAVIKGDPQ